MKDRKPIQRSLWVNLKKTVLTDEAPELPKDFWYDTWIPFKVVAPYYFEDENDDTVEVISWDQGILLTHTPMLCTLENIFFSKLLGLDFDDAIEFCIGVSETLEPVSKKKFILKLVEEVGVIKNLLLPIINKGEKSREINQFGITHSLTYVRCNAIEHYLLDNISAHKKILPLSGLPKLLATTTELAEIFGPAIESGMFGDLHEDIVFQLLADAFRISYECDNLKFQPFLRKIFIRQKNTLPLTEQFIVKGLARVKDGSFQSNYIKK